MDDDDYFASKKHVQERQKRNLERQSLYSKNQIKAEFEKRIKTTMIGALSSFEKGFGEFIGLNNDNPTAKQQELCDTWEDVRQEILDRGNKQIRSMLDELDCYEIKYNRYQYKFNIKGDGNERN